MSSMCSKERKKQLTTDLLIIVITMAVVLVLVVGVSDQTKNIVLRVAIFRFLTYNYIESGIEAS